MRLRALLKIHALKRVINFKQHLITGWLALRYRILGNIVSFILQGADLDWAVVDQV